MSGAEGVAGDFRSKLSVPPAIDADPEPSNVCSDNELRCMAQRLTKLIGSFEELEALLQSDAENGIEDPNHQSRYNAVRGCVDKTALRLARLPATSLSELAVLLTAVGPYLALAAENEPRDLLMQSVLACTMRLIFALENNRRHGESSRHGTLSWFVRGWLNRGH